MNNKRKMSDFVQSDTEMDSDTESCPMALIALKFKGVKRKFPGDEDAGPSSSAGGVPKSKKKRQTRVENDENFDPNLDDVYLSSLRSESKQARNNRTKTPDPDVIPQTPPPVVLPESNKQFLLVSSTPRPVRNSGNSVPNNKSQSPVVLPRQNRNLESNEQATRNNRPTSPPIPSFESSPPPTEHQATRNRSESPILAGGGERTPERRNDGTESDESSDCSCECCQNLAGSPASKAIFNTLECLECGRTFPSKSDLKKHLDRYGHRLVYCSHHDRFTRMTDMYMFSFVTDIFMFLQQN